MRQRSGSRCPHRLRCSFPKRRRHGGADSTKNRITEQFALEKTIQLYEWGSAQKLTIHVPQLECDSPDAAYINDELAAMYAADFRQYEDSPEIEPQQDEWSPEIYINWDAYWYGDCVSLVVFRYDGGTDPGYSRGWCFDFATGKQVSVAEMLQRMGLDPDAVQQQMLREAMQTFDRHMAQGGYYEGLRSGGNLASMRMNTLENNKLEDLCLLLPEQDRLVLRGGCSSPAGSGWRQLDVEVPLTPAAPADTPVLTIPTAVLRCSWREPRAPSPSALHRRPPHGTRITASGWNRTAPTPSLALIISISTCALENSAHPSTRWSIC